MQTETTPLERVYNAAMEALEEGEKPYKVREEVEEAIRQYRQLKTK
jgi:hypothetical protein